MIPNFIKKHPIIWIIVLVLIIIFIIPFFINLSYRHSSRFFATEWDASSALGFYGSVLSFVGTVFLGALSLYQNHIIRQQTEEHQRMIEEREHKKNLPQFKLNVTLQNWSTYHLLLKMENFTDNTAIDLTIENIEMFDKNGKKKWFIGSKYFPVLKGNSSISIRFYNPSMNDKDSLCMTVKYKDEFGDNHRFGIKIVNSRSSDHRDIISIQTVRNDGVV